MAQMAYKVSSTTNAYGDKIAGAETALVCHFRQITRAVNTQADMVTISDAMAWFEPDCGLSKGDIIKFAGEHYMVEGITAARKLRSGTVHFIKAELSKYGQIS